jgi:hypothetical protein
MKKVMFAAVVLVLSGCTGGLAVQMVELSSNEQLLIRRQSIGAGVRELNATSDQVYNGRLTREESGS